MPINAAEITEIGGLIAKYTDQQIDLADACLAYLAEREDISAVMTVDRRHFGLFRRSSGDSLVLLP